MLTIHMDSEFPCQILNRDLWKDPCKIIGIDVLTIPFYSRKGNSKRKLCLCPIRARYPRWTRAYQLLPL